jgi:CPA2 family monovalent cation:H+ antiporter-2
MHDISLILTIAAGLTGALVLGLITERLGVSPILGYLLAGFLIGPNSPGFIADPALAAQLAEIGVILMMFGVGLHFDLKYLASVWRVCVLGAVIQSSVATMLGAAVAVAFGWSFGAGVVLGLSISVASTVVLLRVLMDNQMLETSHGRIAVGWLVAEDILTVLVLVLLPTIVHARQVGGSGVAMLQPLAWAMLKLCAMSAIIVWGGGKLIPWLMELIARLRSRELFTLGVLVMAVGIAVGSALIFGASMALGAFLAGIVVGQSKVHHQAAADALPMRDIFAVLFFVSVGMLFDFRIPLDYPWLVLATLAVILLGKPLAALSAVVALGYPLRTALTAAISLSQIGEFSFILGSMGKDLGVLPELGYSVMIACAMITIALNPLVFRQLPRVERFVLDRAWLRRLLTFRRREEQPTAAGPAAPSGEQIVDGMAVEPPPPTAIVVGYGPIGQTLTRILIVHGVRPTIINLNIATVKRLMAEGLPAVYGDASQADILTAAGIAKAQYLLVTLPELAAKLPLLSMARKLNPEVRILTRARYLGERTALEAAGAKHIIYEEGEVAATMAQQLMEDVAAAPSEIAEETNRIRAQLTAGPWQDLFGNHK